MLLPEIESGPLPSERNDTVRSGWQRQGLEEVADAADSLIGDSIAFGSGGAHLGHVMPQEFATADEGFVPFRKPFEPLIDGHCLFQYSVTWLIAPGTARYSKACHRA
jgi:hypothetical protein